MKSLLIVGFPRGFTDETYRIAREMLPGLKEPIIFGGETLNGGELLNSDRCVGLSQDFPFYIRPDDSQFELAYKVFSEILSQHQRGYLLKDVVQPYIVMRYLAENAGSLNVVFVNRPVEHVLFTLWRKNWSYLDNPRNLLRDLKQFKTFDVTTALFNERYTLSFFQTIYAEAQAVSYLDEEFIEKRQGFFRDYKRPLWINNFARIREYESFSFKGFDKFEPEMCGRWSVTERPSIYIRLDEDVQTSTLIQLRLMLPGCFTRSSLVRVNICSRCVGEVNLAPGQIELLDVRFISEDLDCGVLTLTLENESLYQPEGNETRSLGVGIFGIAAFDVEVGKNDWHDRTEASMKLPSQSMLSRLRAFFLTGNEPLERE